MTAFDLDVQDKDLASATFVIDSNRRIVSDFVRCARDEGLTKAKIAKRLGVDRSTVSRLLSGTRNLTLETIGQLYWAMDMLPELVSKAQAPRNHPGIHAEIGSSGVAVGPIHLNTDWRQGVVGTSSSGPSFSLRREAV